MAGDYLSKRQNPDKRGGDEFRIDEIGARNALHFFNQNRQTMVSSLIVKAKKKGRGHRLEPFIKWLHRAIFYPFRAIENRIKIDSFYSHRFQSKNHKTSNNIQDLYKISFGKSSHFPPHNISKLLENIGKEVLEQGGALLDQ